MKALKLRKLLLPGKKPHQQGYLHPPFSAKRFKNFSSASSGEMEGIVVEMEYSGVSVLVLVGFFISDGSIVISAMSVSGNDDESSTVVGSAVMLFSDITLQLEVSIMIKIPILFIREILTSFSFKT